MLNDDHLNKLIDLLTGRLMDGSEDEDFKNEERIYLKE